MSESTSGYLVDTTLLVDVLRGRREARAFLETVDDEVSISTLSVAELFAGARERDELPISQLIGLFRVLPVTSAIAQLGGMHRRTFGASHGCSLVDALIGATAQIHGCALVTHNRRHFPMTDEVIVPYT